jgi:hypothetical protein
MTLRDFDQGSRRAAGLSPALFPFLQGALGNSQQGGKLRLIQAGLVAGDNDRRNRNLIECAIATGLDVDDSVQRLLVDSPLIIFQLSLLLTGTPTADPTLWT